MRHFLYIKAMGVAAIIDGVLMLTIGSRFAHCQFDLCYWYSRSNARRYARENPYELDDEELPYDD